MPFSARDQIDQVYILASIWTETLVYGFYVCLFILAMHVLSSPSPSSTSRERMSVASKVFFGALLLMFGIATFHIIVQMYRMIRGYGWILGGDGKPITYMRTADWDTTANNVLLGMMIWTGDALVCYRCYIIWGYNVYIIILPVLLALASMACHITLYIWWDTQFTTFLGIMPVVDIVYPLNFSQNILTTGLVAFKIIQQHRLSQKSGLHGSNRISLLHVVRILIESAALYTVELLLCIIFYFLNSPLQFVIQAMLIPSIGIVFVLIAIRVHIARNTTSDTATASSVMPPWLSESEPAFNAPHYSQGVGSSDTENSHSLQILGPRVKNGVYTHQDTSTTDRDTDKPRAFAV